MPAVQTPSQRRANAQFQKNITRRVKTNSKDHGVAKHPPSMIRRNIALFFLIIMCAGAVLTFLRFFF
ncbi:ER stress associated protein Tam14 [Schizosaccharomyces osmophilus]|uniref:Stress-associated endoplasmic reticulum protein n=1 Tax=Schizosaccharomyces osmophilus TaxID=2545709 RepID=A0AAE9WDJ3_9SCHI|nr:ER stress associated protein Tam14 [Schizosaccharomyces osmophilus]WBW73614.1 ER stress associated protein Tam14 [Schizosaccharomyces osmophilus]